MSIPDTCIGTPVTALPATALHGRHPGTAWLVTGRLVLRRPNLDDFAAFAAIHADPATNVFNPAGPTTDRRAAQGVFAAWLRHWDSHGFGVWAASLAARPGEPIGFGGVAMREYAGVPRWNLGYRLAAGAWGNGYATELARAALEMALYTIRLGQVHALVRPRHAASIRVLEKAGMERDGVLDDVPGQAPSLVFSARPAA